MMDKDQIVLRGMRENNLRNMDLDLPKEQLIVFAGLSGSGKSSVVFDTIAAESSRQMTSQYSAYERRHMTLYERPDADEMRNLSPVLVVQQKPIGSSTQSDVGSYMDIGPLVRLLYSRIGEPSIGSATDYSRASSFGSCPDCSGHGMRIAPDLHRLVDVDKSLEDYAVQFKPLSPSGWQGRWMITGGIFDPETPIKDWPKDKQDLFLHGPEDADYVIMPFHTKDGPHQSKWDGLLPRFQRLYIDRDISNLKEVSKEDVLAVSTTAPCPTCQGTGLNPKVLASKIQGLNIAEMYQLELKDLLEVLGQVDDPLGQSLVGQMEDIVQRMIDMGLGYLHLSRKVSSLSGGEAQRLKIARQLGSSLNNMTYILDEPSAGLHPTEVGQLIDMVKNLRDQYNTVIIVEHHPLILAEADQIVEIGPGSGEAGGELIFQGPPSDLTDDTPTGRALRRPLTIKESVRDFDDSYPLRHANRHNLKDVSVDIPSGVLVTVAGVSGSGKSSLISEEFYDRYSEEAIKVDQKGIGASTRSNLATYMGIMDDIRQTFARETGQEPGLFSFNSTGACPKCGGKGEIQPDVAFADPVTLPCDYCDGTRYSDEARSYTYKGKNIVEVLDLTVEDASSYFERDSIQKRVQTLNEVGLGYLTLGQSTATFSGGELQRLKLASQLQHSGKIYILDEPSLGLHPEDSRALLKLFNELVDRGNTVILIEHNLGFVAQSDWVIELGPGGGSQGGEIIFEGRPGDLVGKDTPTAQALRQAMEK